MTVEKKKLARRGIKVIFYLYIIGIFYFVLLSERYGRDTGYDTSHVNLVLFKEINRFWTYRHLLSTEAVVTNLFGNIFAFSPFGFMIPIVINKKKAFFRAVFATSFFSLAKSMTPWCSEISIILPTANPSFKSINIIKYNSTFI